MSLVLRDIHKHFGSVRANDGIDLDIASGELHGLLGENGAGKSTLMKVLSGFLTADSGSIEPGWETAPRVVATAALDSGIGMLHQDPLVFLPLRCSTTFFLVRRADRSWIARRGGVPSPRPQRSTDSISTPTPRLDPHRW